MTDPRDLPVRYSRLKKMGQSPAHYLEAAKLGDDDGRDTLCLRIGRGGHALLLGQPIIAYPDRRAGKAWEAFQAEHADKVILNEREYGIATGIAGAIFDHSEAAELLLGEGTLFEQRIDWSLGDRACRSTPDSRTATRLVDLKTCRSSAPSFFSWQARNLAYHGQLAFYADALEATTGRAPDEVYIVAVESTRPHPVTIFRVGPETLDLGRRLYRLWFEQLLVCEASNHWPGYASSIVDLLFDEAPTDGAVVTEADEEPLELAG